jgi:formylmethanofuran dehydrogenase subunit E
MGIICDGCGEDIGGAQYAKKKNGKNYCIDCFDELDAMGY